MKLSPASIDAIYLDRVRKLCEDDLLFFARYFFKELRGELFIVNHHHQKIADALKDIETGGNLLINMPPRYGKTELAVICWIAQSIARNPKARFIHLSFSAELALENSAKCRELIKSPQFQQLWPIQIKADADSKAKWYTEQGGGLYATMAGGAVTGFGAGITAEEHNGFFGGAIIVDDPIKPSDARSAIERTKVNERLNSTIKNRRNNRNTPIVIIMQRLHPDDMSGFVQSGGMGEPFKHVCISALNEDGSALWPMKHTAQELIRMRDTPEDRANFWSQYQQSPIIPDGDVFKLDWWKRHESIPESAITCIHSWDTAYKSNEHNDPSSCLVMRLESGGNMAYTQEVINKRMEYPELKRTIISLAARDKPVAILIEDKASGQSLIQELRAETGLPVLAIKPDADKLTRAVAASALIESGRISLPKVADWLYNYENQIVSFPNGSHDDMVDATSQFINWWRTQSYGVWNEQVREIFNL